MNRLELNEAVKAWGAVVEVLAATPFDRSAGTAPELRRACGVAVAGGRAAIASGSFGTILAACFEASRLSGPPAEFFSRVRSIAEAQTQTGLPAAAVVTLAVRLSLASEADALSRVEFKSRDDVDVALTRIRPGFEAVIDAAMANRESDAHKTFGQLYAAVVGDLTARARRMPRVVAYHTGLPLPSLALANRLYGDAGRAGELAAENKAVHPLFMPAQGRALAS